MRLSEPFNLNLPKIRCRCGAEILLVPNIELMSEAIEIHVDEHKKRVRNRREAEAEAERTREDLIVKVLTKAAEA